ncbi:exonuclease domain-containing protein [uncultured Bifidobacterium sp.]|uniref:exonuclease domain-containing protein n=1 Tax=uncultured Bifidobacterium sp. TaxID=165187 RepID=UPI0028DBD3EE|nr:exonuclease domain-containing protein [uncultured Bifidobacterium sp.]
MTLPSTSSSSAPSESTPSTSGLDALLATLHSLDPQPRTTTLHDSRLLGFDTETTGARPGRDAIVSACLVLRDPSQGHEGDVRASWIINPHRRMSAGASAVNRFTDDFLEENGDEPTTALAQIAEAIRDAQRLGIPLLAYNAPFDVAMLQGDLGRWSLPSVDAGLVVDPLVIDRQVSRRHGRRTLSDTTAYYGVEPDGNFHDAAADTTAAVDLIAPMSVLYPQVGALGLDGIMDWQRRAHEEWKASFNAWLESRGRRPITDGWL